MERSSRSATVEERWSGAVVECCSPKVLAAKPRKIVAQQAVEKRRLSVPEGQADGSQARSAWEGASMSPSR